MDGTTDVAHVRSACCFSAPYFPHPDLHWQHNMSAVRYRTATWLMREQRLAQVQVNQSINQTAA